jgi:NADH-quinone oxidoreductase subunit J
MSLTAFFFYLFASVTVASAFMVIASRNPVHSVLFLIVTFFNSAGLFLLVGAEFLAMILVVVYVGAVAVLFLFVVMMLDIDFAELRQGFLQYMPVGALIGLILLAELIMVVSTGVVSAEGVASVANVPIPPVGEISNTKAIGLVLYTDYVFYFQMAGLILLVAMIGAIVLTLREARPGLKKQNPGQQSARTRDEAVEIKTVKPGQGL